MSVSVYLPAVLSVPVAVVGRQVAIRLAPTPGTVIALVAPAVWCAAGTTWALVLLALTLLGFTRSPWRWPPSTAWCWRGRYPGWSARWPRWRWASAWSE